VEIREGGVTKADGGLVKGEIKDGVEVKLGGKIKVDGILKDGEEIREDGILDGDMINTKLLYLLIK
jgi:hypothetical protein